MRQVTCIVLFLIVAGCTAMPADPMPRLNFSNLTPIKLNVASIEVIDDYTPPMQAPNVEHLFATPFYDAVQLWAKQRLGMAGPEGFVRLTITEASVKEVSLPIEQGLRGMLTRQQAYRYDARLAVQLEADAPGVDSRGYITVVAERSRTIVEGVSLAEKERAWHEITKSIMDDLDKSVERSLRQRLPGLVIN